MPEIEKFEVRFDEYCPRCKYKDTSDEYDEKCDICLESPFNDNSVKPVNFKEREGNSNERTTVNSKNSRKKKV